MIGPEEAYDALVVADAIRRSLAEGKEIVL
jgi:hypothetical protein